jgi:hypothetical protein
VQPRHLLALAALLVSCEQPEPAPFTPECKLNAFRACELEACRGVEQCLPPGLWSACACTITDASFPEAAPAADAGADSADGS